MAFTVDINLQRDLETSCSTMVVFSLLADVPRSAAHFPGVDRLVDLGGNAYRWEMEKIGIGGYTLQQTIYACQYLDDASAGRVFWTPIEGVGNAGVEGEWIVAPKEEGTTVRLNTRGRLTVDFPSFLQFVLSPLVQMEFTGMVDRYIENLGKTFSIL
ncbi:MAG: SRPBCC family protein [Chlorobium sp.]|uniref:SRPBCC family protein n=1 Tax=Chlorobium sp. TaxID=1095 RepID=UPI0025B9E123|nr:SRPBCC family protein [Chlorobium sp.]MCF8292157.1 SRPBCC family protein [Chlorobium sp.]MCF8382974.1 SRPBCC family protein [Chlorobium sp.]